MQEVSTTHGSRQLAFTQLAELPSRNIGEISITCAGAEAISQSVNVCACERSQGSYVEIKSML